MEPPRPSAGRPPSSPTPEPEPGPATGPADAADLSRRRFLTAGTSAAAALALGGPAALAQGHAHPRRARPASGAPAAVPRRTKVQAYYQPFGEPPVISSQDGVLEATLRVVQVPISIPEEDGVRVEMTRTYNGMVPGPTLKVRAGDRMRVDGGGLHPFHIHINPFIVVHNGSRDVPEEERFWQDTVLINGTVRLLTKYQNFHGRFVLHCHILNHEDWGMMRAVEVVGTGYGPCQEVATELPSPGSGT